jgi:peroxiredoxin
MLLLLCCLVPLGCDRETHPQQLDTPAPPFTLTDGNDTLALSQFRGHVVLLNFWASWCAPCVQELPDLNALQHVLSTQLPQVALIGISFDASHDAYSRFLTRHEVDFRTLNDPDQRVNALYRTYRPPETFIIDKQGIIRRKFIGPQDWTNPDIVKYLQKLAAA